MTVTLTHPHPLAGTRAHLLGARGTPPVYLLRLAPGSAGPEGDDLSGCVLPCFAGSFEIESEETTP